VQEKAAGDYRRLPFVCAGVAKSGAIAALVILRGVAMTATRRLYRPTEAAEALGVSRAKLYALLSSGALGSVKIGASRRIPAADLDAFVHRLRSESGLSGATHAETFAADEYREPIAA
jgi:excisionase family DNA binding protein